MELPLNRYMIHYTVESRYLLAILNSDETLICFHILKIKTTIHLKRWFQYHTLL